MLYDVFMLRDDAVALAGKIKASGKNLARVFISHAHPDHFMGTEVIVEHFPDAEIISTPATIANIEEDGPWMLELLQARNDSGREVDRQQQCRRRDLLRAVQNEGHEGIMKIGIIGAGNVRTGLTKHLVPRGHSVMLSFHRDLKHLRSLPQFEAKRESCSLQTSVKDFCGKLDAGPVENRPTLLGLYMWCCPGHDPVFFFRAERKKKFAPTSQLQTRVYHDSMRSASTAFRRIRDQIHRRIGGVPGWERQGSRLSPT